MALAPTTFLDLCADAMTEIGALGTGETPNSDDAFLCMREFNRMMGEWSTDRLLLFTVGSSTFPLTPTKQSYQVGPGAVDFPLVPRPIVIQTAAVIYPGTTARKGVDLLSSQEWASLGETGLSGVFPDKLYCDYAMPFCTFNVHPIPTGPITLEVYSFGLLQQITGLTDVLNFPPGYENALKYVLAVKICSSFGMPLGQMTVQQAVAGKASIAQVNANLYRGALGTSSMFPLPTQGAPAPPAPAGQAPTQ